MELVISTIYLPNRVQILLYVTYCSHHTSMCNMLNAVELKYVKCSI